jgi:hypothetical protein
VTRLRPTSRSSTAVLVALVVLGLGVAAAPLIFSMFDRAPKGADMIDEFRPFMTDAQIHEFRGFLSEMGAAAAESKREIDPAAAARLAITPAEYTARAQYLTAFEAAWPHIDADMTDMLDRMDANLGNYRGVDALPRFGLFPWFFVVPGLLVAGLAGVVLLKRRRSAAGRGALVAIVIVGAGLVAAPAVFQMFTRAPHGGEMIDDFRPLMTREKLTTIQGYFITIGNGEADLRNVALPAAAPPAGTTPAVERFVTDWPRINREMAPFVGVMADNLGNFAAVDALPPFALFPWFFVIPGVLIAGLGVVALRRSQHQSTFPEPGGSVSNPRKQTVRTTALTTVVIAMALVTSVAVATPVGARAAKSTSLVGTFGVTAADCVTGAPQAGSYFRMVQPGGTTSAGPFIANGDSACGDKTYTALAPGSAGGLATGKYQPEPAPPFDATGNGLASTILTPTKFFGLNFAVSTNPTDPQTGTATKKPTVKARKSKLSGDLDAFGVSYGNQQFNQGSPKPDGSSPGATSAPTGTYSAKTGTYTLEWSSAIVGGPFDGFTGVWHFEGKYTKKG